MLNIFKILHCLKKAITIIVLLIFYAVAGNAEASLIYYVDATNGSDLNTGLSMASAWQTISKVNQFPFAPGDKILFKRSESWREQLIPQSGSQEGYVTYGAYGMGKPLLLGSINKSNEQDWTHKGDNVWYSSDIPFDVGNLIFNNEGSVGIKVRNEEELDQQGEFWYDPDNLVLKLYSETNPAFYYTNIECALKRDIINQGGKEYIIYENLDLRYGGSHGIGGGNVHHIIVRNCDLSYIGGSRQYGELRYGNAIEFWNSSYETIVEGCKLREIYDAALTTQGSGEGNSKYNQYFRNNIIWNSEYCFEYWNGPESAITHDIYFENNTCVNGGYGWGHNQRWKETDAGWHNGKLLAFYDNTASTHGLYIRNNIFFNAKNSLYSLEGKWTGDELAILDYNALYQSSVQMINFPPCIYGECGYECASYTVDQFMEYQTESGKDEHSLVINPLFMDEANNDYRPAEGSPVCTMSQSGSYVGALPCVHVNVPPSIPKLVYPPDSWISPETTIEFRWEKYSDPNDDIAYGLYICENKEFTANCISKIVITHNESSAMYFEGTGAVFLFFTVAFACIMISKGNHNILLVMMVMSALIIIACGSSGKIDSENIPSGHDISQTIGGLKAGTDYFWKVIATDQNGGEAVSETRSFSTR